MRLHLQKIQIKISHDGTGFITIVNFLNCFTKSVLCSLVQVTFTRQVLSVENDWVGYCIVIHEILDNLEC